MLNRSRHALTKVAKVDSCRILKVGLQARCRFLRDENKKRVWLETSRVVLQDVSHRNCLIKVANIRNRI